MCLFESPSKFWGFSLVLFHFKMFYRILSEFRFTVALVQASQAFSVMPSDQMCNFYALGRVESLFSVVKKPPVVEHGGRRAQVVGQNRV